MNQLKPYLLRATRDWCLDNGLTPHLLVDATAAGVVVPTSHIEDGKIVLNTSPRAIQAFDIDDGGVRFAARFRRQGILRRSATQRRARDLRQGNRSGHYLSTGVRGHADGQGRHAAVQRTPARRHTAAQGPRAQDREIAGK